MSSFDCSITLFESPLLSFEHRAEASVTVSIASVEAVLRLKPTEREVKNGRTAELHSFFDSNYQSTFQSDHIWKGREFDRDFFQF
jgi:hypothetical protein